MNSYHRVKKAIEFKKPDRIPLTYFFRQGNDDDIADGGYKRIEEMSRNEVRESGLEKYVDEWGCVWTLNPRGSRIDNQGYMREHPIRDYCRLKYHPFPDPDDSRQYEDIPATLKKNEGKYILQDWFTLFERAWHLRGMENIFMDMYDNPGHLDELLTIISNFAVRVIANLSDFGGRIHGLYMADDLGTQIALFMRMKQFRRFLKPHYEKIIDTAHKCGMHVWFHSDGKINDLIEEFIDIDLDVINLEQPLMVGIDDVSHRYRGRIAFQPIVDIQKTLITGTPEEIEKQVREIIQKWGMPEGGIIAMDYWDYEAIGIDKSRARFAYEAWKKYGVYR